MKPIRFYPDAQIELIESARYYEDRQSGLGKRFLEAIRNATQRIQLFPTIFQHIDGDLRRARVERFPYGIVFRERDEYIEIIAVMHFKRNPEYWKTRSG